VALAAPPTALALAAPPAPLPLAALAAPPTALALAAPPAPLPLAALAALAAPPAPLPLAALAAPPTALALAAPPAVAVGFAASAFSSSKALGPKAGSSSAGASPSAVRPSCAPAPAAGALRVDAFLPTGYAAAFAPNFANACTLATADAADASGSALTLGPGDRSSALAVAARPGVAPPAARGRSRARWRRAWPPPLRTRRSDGVAARPASRGPA
jgi:hypothetical protein